MDFDEALDAIEPVDGSDVQLGGATPALWDFSESEYRRRFARLRTLMATGELDAVVLTQEESVRYLSGYNSVIWVVGRWLPSAIVVTADPSRSVLIQSIFDAGCARGTSWFPTIDSYTDVAEIPGKLAAHVRDAAGAGARVGMEMSPGSAVVLPFEVARAVVESIDGTVADAARIMHVLRMLKSDEELQRVRQSVQAAVAGYDAARTGAKAGMTEREIIALMGAKMYASGLTAGTRPLFLNAVAGPDEYAMADKPASDHPLSPGDVVFLDGGGGAESYMSDLIRMVLVDCDDEQRSYANAAADATAAMVEAARPGMTASELYEAGVDAYRPANMEGSAGSLFGHGIGMEVWEQPFIRRHDDPADDVRLRPGMTICIEPMNVPTTDEGAIKALYVIEQMVAITADGNELLSDGLDARPWEVPA
jgi:Xaa-Pro aminopeptidase